MKTFNDLKVGDYVYELDTFSGNVEYLKISKFLSFAPNDRVIIFFNNNTSICFHKDESFESLFGVTYFCNQKETVSYEGRFSRC